MKRSAKHLPAGRYRLELDEAAVQTIVDGLAAMPLARALPVLQAVQAQCHAQDVERSAEAAAAQRRKVESELRPLIEAEVRAQATAARPAEKLNAGVSVA